MPVAFRVRFRSTKSEQGEWELSQLPIRIGRNALNHCQISDRYVSDFHAVIELVDNALYVRDLHSTNGVYAPSGARIDSSVPLKLTAPEHAFALGQFYHLQIDVYERSAGMDTRSSARRGNILGNPQVLAPAANDAYSSGVVLREGRAAGPPAGLRDPRFEIAPLPPLSMGARMPHMVSEPAKASWAQPPAAAPLDSSLPGLAPLRQQPPRGSSAAPPAYPQPSEERAAMMGTQHFAMSTETMASACLRELAAAFVPGVPLQTTGDIARLLTKLHDTVEMFCRCFVPLREGYAQFVSQMDLDRAASQRSLNRSQSAMRVETAKDPAALASALLDWRNQDYDAPEVVEGIFADLMIHQIALVDGVMRGVQALLEELSPEKIEATIKENRSPAMFGRHRELWKAFQTRYDELANATRSFEVVFGADFAGSYRDHLARQRGQ